MRPYWYRERLSHAAVTNTKYHDFKPQRFISHPHYLFTDCVSHLKMLPNKLELGSTTAGEKSGLLLDNYMSDIYHFT